MARAAPEGAKEVAQGATERSVQGAAARAAVEEADAAGAKEVASGAAARVEQAVLVMVGEAALARGASGTAAVVVESWVGRGRVDWDLVEVARVRVGERAAVGAAQLQR